MSSTQLLQIPCSQVKGLSGSSTVVDSKHRDIVSIVEFSCRFKAEPHRVWESRYVKYLLFLL